MGLRDLEKKIDGKPSAGRVIRLEAEIERLKSSLGDMVKINAQLQEQVQHEIKVGCEAEEEIDRLRAALKATQWGFNHCRCPVCAGWNMSPYGETDFKHTPDCIVGKCLNEQ